MSWKLSTESGAGLCFLNCPPADSIPLCNFKSSFLPDFSELLQVVSVLSVKPVNSGVPPGSVLFPTLCMIYNNLALATCPVHSYADDAALHNSIYFYYTFSPKELHDLWPCYHFWPLLCPSVPPPVNSTQPSLWLITYSSGSLSSPSLPHLTFSTYS